MKKKSYKKFEDQIQLVSTEPVKPKILLHTCCAPCSSASTELIREYFDITLYFYNPNIYPESEHKRREQELFEFIKKFDPEGDIKILNELYSPLDFANCSLGLEYEKERGKRCYNCYDLRLSKTAEKARELDFDYFSTTLTISPHKDAEKINEIGEDLSKIYEVKFLNTDFKKRNGFKRSLELSKEYGLYRQDYCGCEFSMEKNRKE